MPSQEVCAANAVTHYVGNKACLSSCTFIPEVEPKMMVCAIGDDGLANLKPGAGNDGNGDLGKLYTWCSVVHTSLLFWMRVCVCQPLFLINGVWRFNTGVIVVVTIFSQWSGPAPSSWWVSIISIHFWVYGKSLTSLKLLVQSLSFAAQSFVVILIGANLGQFSSSSQPMTICSVWTNFIRIALVLRRFYWIQSQYLAQIFPEKWHYFIHKIKIGTCTTSTSRRVVFNICTTYNSTKWCGLKW